MFTSNDKASKYGLVELVGGGLQAQGPYTPPEDTSSTRLKKSTPTSHHDAFRFEVDPDLQRKVRFRPRKFDVRVEDLHESSLDGKPERFWTPPENLTPAEAPRKKPAEPQSTTTTTSQQPADEEGPKQLLLQLRAALNEKELQLVELREQHIAVLNRAADARHTWEAALQAKDRVIVQLQRTLKHHKSHQDKQERESQESLHALRKRQKQENAEVEKKELKVALLEAKNAQFVQELVEQQKIITRMKRLIDEKEKACGNHHQKLETMNKRIQDLKSALHMKEEEATTQGNKCNELKSLLWKRDNIIAQLQLSEQQLQSSLACKEAAKEAQAISQEDVQVEENAALHKKSLSQRQKQHISEHGTKASHKDHLEREHRHQCEIGKLMELKDNFSNIHKYSAMNVKELNDKEGVMHLIQKRMRELQRSLRSKDMALSDRNNEYQDAVMEIRRLTEEYEAMKHKCEELSRRNHQLENTIAHLQYPDRGANLVSEDPTPPVEVLRMSYDFSHAGSTGEDIGFDNAMQDSMMEWEQFSNASVYHANFEKIKITEVEMPDIEEQQQGSTHPSFHFPLPVIPPPTSPPPYARLAVESKECLSAGPPDEDVGHGLPSVFEENYKSIQDEIKKREQSWRKTEEQLREALTHQMKLLGQSKSSSRHHAKPPRAHSTLTQLHHLQAAARGDTRGAYKHNRSNWTPCRNNGSRQYGPHDMEAVHRHGLESGGHHHRRRHHHHHQATYEQELLGYELDQLNYNLGKVDGHKHHDVGRKYGGEQMQNVNLDYRRQGRVA